jgi:hypothetical protein
MMTDKTMTPISIEEILELPIGSKVAVELVNFIVDKRETFNYRVSSVSSERIELDKEIRL